MKYLFMFAGILSAFFLGMMCAPKESEIDRIINPELRAINDDLAENYNYKTMKTLKGVRGG